MEIQEIIIKNDVFRYLEIFATLIAALGAGIFGWKQFEINRRLKNLQDYVAVSIIPQNNLKLQILNVGKINLYIHKWEVGRLNENFTKAVLVPTGTNSFIEIGLNGLWLGEYDFKMYITDEMDKKYISTGKIFIEPASISTQSLSIINPPSTGETQTQGANINPVQTIISTSLRAYSYKTKKYDWKL
ncbi:MAG: hypothetical protein WCV69_04680 [Patescibacteria group bacterium]|jgi:hypothetical protein